MDIYPVYGLTSLRETALSVVYPDGNMTLDMRVKGVSKKQEADSSVTTVVEMADSHYPLTAMAATTACA